MITARSAVRLEVPGVVPGRFRHVVARPWDEEILAALASAVPDVHGIEAAA